MYLKTPVFALSGLCIMVLAGCSLIEPRKKQLYQFELPGKESLKIMYLHARVGGQAAIQVSKQNAGNDEHIVNTFERYNRVDTAYLQDNTLLILVMRNTTAYLGSRADTMKIRL